MTGPLASHDVAIWQTCHINELVDAAQLGTWQGPPAHFALGRPAERVLATGPFTLSSFQAVGDGTYTHDSGFFFATGRYGTALTLGTMAGRAIGNSRRRQQAARDAQPRWVPIAAGQIWVSQFGFYCQEQAQFYSWDFGAIDAAQLLGPGHLQIMGTSHNGPINWVLTSDWAELVFTMWARQRQPGHPQFSQGGWIPPGWRDRVLAARQELPKALTHQSSLRRVLEP